MIRAVTLHVLGLLCVFGTYAQPGIHVRSDGNVGINHITPQSNLVIHGTPATLRLGTLASESATVSGMLIFDNNLNDSTEPTNYCGMALQYNKTMSALQFMGGCDPVGDGEDAPVALMSIDRYGNVGIGAPPDSFKLQVAGSVRSEEIIVETGWADYVFEDDYFLSPLADVESYIEENGHLPDIPSARVVESQGLRVGEMSSRFMQKIEELTLYTIDQEKRIKSQQEELERLQRMVSMLSSELESIKASLEED